MKFDLKFEQLFDERSRYLCRVMLAYFWLTVPFWFHFKSPFVLPFFIPLMALFAFYTFWGRFTFSFIFMMSLVVHYFFQVDGISYVFLVPLLLNHKYSSDHVLNKNVWSKKTFSPFLTKVIRVFLMAGVGFASGHFLLEMVYSPSDFEHTILYPFMFLLVPKRLWDWMKNQFFPTQGQITIYYDEKCQFCLKGVALLKAFILHETVKTIPCQADFEIHQLMIKENSWVVRSSEGDLTTGHKAILVMIADSPILFWLVPILELSFIQKKMEEFYFWLSNNRGVGAYWLNLLLEFNFKPSK